MTEEVPAAIGRMIRSERRRRRWTQRKLASAAGMRRETIYRLEKGRIPTIDTVLRVEAAFGLASPHFAPDWVCDSSPDAPGLGPRTRRRRRQLGLTLAACAEAAGVSVATLSRFERGVDRSPALAEVLHGVVAHAIRNDGLAAILGFADSGEMTRYCLSVSC